MKFIALFAGIGGFYIAFKNVGGTCVFASEWDENARKTYDFNHRKTSPELFENANLLLEKIKNHTKAKGSFRIDEITHLVDALLDRKKRCSIKRLER